jgi:hypothetical protein
VFCCTSSKKKKKKDFSVFKKERLRSNLQGKKKNTLRVKFSLLESKILCFLLHGEGFLDTDAASGVGSASSELTVGLAKAASRAAARFEACAEEAFVDLVLLDDLGADLAGLDEGSAALGEEESNTAHGGVVGINVALDGFTLTTDLEAAAAPDVEAGGSVIHAAEEASLPFRSHLFLRVLEVFFFKFFLIESAKKPFGLFESFEFLFSKRNDA